MPASRLAGSIRIVAVVLDHVGDVLLERPTRVHGHHLHAAADADGGQSAQVGGGEQRELPGITLLVPRDRPSVRCLAVPLGLDVGTAGDDQAIQACDHGRGAFVVRQRRRQHDRRSAGCLDRERVVAREQVR
jgi:hypothetical protein